MAGCEWRVAGPDGPDGAEPYRGLALGRPLLTEVAAPFIERGLPRLKWWPRQKIREREGEGERKFQSGIRKAESGK